MLTCLPTHLTTREVVAEEYLVRHFPSTPQALGEGELENAHWLPGTGNPAQGLTEVRSDVAPLLRLLESGRFNPGHLRPLKSAPWKE